VERNSESKMEKYEEYFENVERIFGNNPLTMKKRSEEKVFFLEKVNYPMSGSFPFLR
jgi:hypothetical protein